MLQKRATFTRHEGGVCRGGLIWIVFQLATRGLRGLPITLPTASIPVISSTVQVLIITTSSQ